MEKETIPYFYIIRHKASGKKYAGARWQKGCKPSELLKEDGYKTNSGAIKRIIEKEGLDSLEIISIVEVENVYEYETYFLQTNDCASSDEWLNYHNNTGKPPPYGSKEFKKMMLEKYGVEHNTQIPSSLENMKKKQKENYENNPEMLYERAKKIRLSRVKNCTTGEGIKRPNYTNNGNNGRYERTEEVRAKVSKNRIGKALGERNAMASEENRRKVAESKIGRKKYKNPMTGEWKYCIPGTEPEGFIR